MYTIWRHVKDEPSFLDLFLDDDCFFFASENEADKCLKLCFHGGEYYQDEKYGICRCYVCKLY